MSWDKSCDLCSWSCDAGWSWWSTNRERRVTWEMASGPASFVALTSVAMVSTGGSQSLFTFVTSALPWVNNNVHKAIIYLHWCGSFYTLHVEYCTPPKALGSVFWGLVLARVHVYIHCTLGLSLMEIGVVFAVNCRTRICDWFVMPIVNSGFWIITELATRHNIPNWLQVHCCRWSCMYVCMCMAVLECIWSGRSSTL